MRARAVLLALALFLLTPIVVICLVLTTNIWRATEEPVRVGGAPPIRGIGDGL